MNVRAASFAPEAGFASVQGQVWHDVNHDGVHQPQEPGMAGITVTLYFSDSVQVTQTLTNGTGHYTFTQLQPATYTLGVQAPTSFSPTLFGRGPTGSDSLIRANGRTDPFGLTAGAVLTQVNAGLWKSVILSDESASTEKHRTFLPFIAAPAPVP